MDDLHGKIMNIPCDVSRMDMNSKTEILAYKMGHRDARHAAAELAAAALSQPAAQGGNAASGLSDWQLRDMGIDPSKRHSQSFEWPFPKPKATP